MDEPNLQQEAMKKDYLEVLSTEAGRRVFGGIFHKLGLNTPITNCDVETMIYRAGLRAAVQIIANTIREANPRAVAECEIAYEKYEKYNNYDRRFTDGREDN